MWLDVPSCPSCLSFFLFYSFFTHIHMYFPSPSLPSLGLIMIGVIIGARKVGINPDNVATPIAASLGDLITLSLLAGLSSTLYEYIGNTDSLFIHSQAEWVCVCVFVVLFKSRYPIVYPIFQSRDISTSFSVWKYKPMYSHEENVRTCQFSVIPHVLIVS